VGEITHLAEVGKMNFFPCKPDDPTGPTYDEMIVFNSAQILPRYLIYYNKLSLSDKNRVVLWVCDDFNAAYVAGLPETIRSLGIVLYMFNNSRDVRHWLIANAKMSPETASEYIIFCLSLPLISC
jgi:hypothetical protein